MSVESGPPALEWLASLEQLQTERESSHPQSTHQLSSSLSLSLSLTNGSGGVGEKGCGWAEGIPHYCLKRVVGGRSKVIQQESVVVHVWSECLYSLTLHLHLYTHHTLTLSPCWGMYSTHLDEEEVDGVSSGVKEPPLE